MTVARDSIEHVEAWLRLEDASREIARTVNDLGEIVVDEEFAANHGYKPEAVGKKIKEVGLAPGLLADTLPMVDEATKRAAEITPPSREAFTRYELHRLNEKLDRVLERLDDLERHL